LFSYDWDNFEKNFFFNTKRKIFSEVYFGRIPLNLSIFRWKKIFEILIRIILGSFLRERKEAWTVFSINFWGEIFFCFFGENKNLVSCWPKKEKSSQRVFAFYFCFHFSPKFFFFLNKKNTQKQSLRETPLQSFIQRWTLFFSQVSKPSHEFGCWSFFSREKNSEKMDFQKKENLLEFFFCAFFIEKTSREFFVGSWLWLFEKKFTLIISSFDCFNLFSERNFFFL